MSISVVCAQRKIIRQISNVEECRWDFYSAGGVALLPGLYVMAGPAEFCVGVGAVVVSLPGAEALVLASTS